jgi:16S rRNA processing protein RimM
MALVGHVARPHGIKGQFVVNPLTDFPEERFSVGATLFALRDGCIEPFTVSASRMQGGRPVIAVEGVTDMDGARELAGLEFRVPVDALVALPDGMFYYHDLIGSMVETVDGRQVGTVSDVEGDTANSRLVVRAETGEILIPLAFDICTTIDTAAKRIVIAPPSGLLDVNRR